MNQNSPIKFLKISGRPRFFYGTLRLPPSKSYLHRALFVSGLASGGSTLVNCGTESNDDIAATIAALTSLGSDIQFSAHHNGSFLVSRGAPRSTDIALNAGGSGTTARFLIAYSALTPKGTKVTISGNESLSKRPMKHLIEPLQKLGVNVSSANSECKLPISIQGGGIIGGDCVVDGSISSQFVSSLLISCVKAKRESTVSIRNPDEQVSTPYIDATLQVLRAFNFRIQIQRTRARKYSCFRIRGGQSARGRKFTVPGDMSSAAALVCATMAARGKVRLTNVGEKQFPQPDYAIIGVARKFGANVDEKNDSISVVFQDRSNLKRHLSLDFKDSPDLVPAVAGLAAATGTQISISNIGHLRFKESDRISVLTRELSKIGIETEESRSTLRVHVPRSEFEKLDSAVICPEGDHRMLMALTIAALSGSFGSIYIAEPECVRKSYPSFVEDLQKLCHEKTTLKIVSSFKPARKET